MSGSTKWYRLAVLGGGVAAVSGLLYYLFRENSGSRATDADEPEKEESNKLNVATATKDQVLAVLQRVVQSQEAMKVIMKDLIRSLISRDLIFTEVYQEVQAVQPDDPLEASGLTMQEFDQLLMKYQNDPEITQTVAQIMGMGPAASTSASAAAESLSLDTIVNIHAYMLDEIKKLVTEVRNLPHPESYDMKTVTIAVQAIVGARVEKKFSVTSDQLEVTVLRHHAALELNPEFARINLEMQAAISSLIELCPGTVRL